MLFKILLTKLKQVIRNSEFLLKINPIKVTFTAFSVWALLFFTAPLKVNIDIDWSAYLLMALSIGAFLLACKIPSRSFKTYEVNENRLKSVFKVILMIAIFGVSLKLIDRFLIRGISISAGNMLNRDQMETGSGNPIGIISSILAPFSYIPLFIMWKYKLELWWLLRWGVIIVFFAQIFDSFLLGSRSIIFVNLIFLFLYLIYFKKIILKLKTYLLLGLLGVFLFGVMNYIFIQRTKEFFGDQVYELALNESNFNFTATRTDEFKKSFDKKGDIGKSISFSYIITAQYFTHGMLEFSYLYSNYNNVHTYGRYTFDLYFRLFDKVLPTNLAVGDPEDFLPRSGVYTTLLGPLFVDFGWFMIVFMFFFGKIVKAIYNTALNGADWAIIMYFYIFIILVFWPVFNFLSGAGGIFTITSFIIFAILSGFTYEKKNA